MKRLIPALTVLALALAAAPAAEAEGNLATACLERGGIWSAADNICYRDRLDEEQAREQRILGAVQAEYRACKTGRYWRSANNGTQTVDEYDEVRATGSGEFAIYELGYCFSAAIWYPHTTNPEGAGGDHAYGGLWTRWNCHSTVEDNIGSGVWKQNVGGMTGNSCPLGYAD